MFKLHWHNVDLMLQKGGPATGSEHKWKVFFFSEMKSQETKVRNILLHSVNFNQTRVVQIKYSQAW